ncbi:hypothetical protein KW805_05050 [Candidatus Pacearchaeota archaeon]|nr:hypothetical protein [Candidatus Pacearchaeota archaeon]
MEDKSNYTPDEVAKMMIARDTLVNKMDEVRNYWKGGIMGKDEATRSLNEALIKYEDCVPLNVRHPRAVKYPSCLEVDCDGLRVSIDQGRRDI